jgi:hypothetical protein
VARAFGALIGQLTNPKIEALEKEISKTEIPTDNREKELLLVGAATFAGVTWGALKVINIL